jgi:hypothetical protein
MATRKPTATPMTAKNSASKPPGKSVTPAKAKAAAKPVEKKSATKPVVTPPGKSAVRKSTTPKHITPKKALANTLALLEAKNEKSRQPPSYPSGGGAYGHQHAFGSTENQAHSQHQPAPGIEPEATEGHNVPRGNQGDRSQS